MAEEMTEREGEKEEEFLRGVMKGMKKGPQQTLIGEDKIDDSFTSRGKSYTREAARSDELCSYHLKEKHKGSYANHNRKMMAGKKQSRALGGYW